MRYSVITPSILRSTLPKLCQSIDEQTNQDFEHIIMVDIPLNELDIKQRAILFSLSRNKRKVLFCEKRHMSCGNICRGKAQKHAIGDYLYFIDDDDYLADSIVLESFNQVTTEWALFAMNLCGKYFYHYPPGMCRVTTGQFLIRRGLIDWPEVPNYETDGMVVEELLKRNIPYQAFPQRVVAVHPAYNLGKYV